MHRLLFLPLCACLVVASGLTAMTLIALNRPLHSEATETASIRVVRSFYAAANAMIITGDPALLREVVSPELRNPGGEPFDIPSREILESYLSFLHEQSPQSQIFLDEVASSPDRVVTRATIGRVALSEPFGLAPAAPLAAWPTVETFTVSGERIVERYADWSGLLWMNALRPWPLDPAIHPHRVVRVATSQIEPGARIDFLAADSISLLHAEQGFLEFTLAEDSRSGAVIEEIQEQMSGTARSTVLPGQRALLDSEQLLLVPPGNRFVIQNQTGETASLTSVIALVPQDDSPEALLEVNHGTAGVTHEQILELDTGSVSESMAYNLGLVTLMPGAAASVDDSANFLVVCPVAESLDQISVSESIGHIPRGELVFAPHSLLHRTYLFNALARPVTFFTIAIVPAST